MDEETKKLVDAWIKMSAAHNLEGKNGPDYETNFWAFMRLSDLVNDDPERAWPIILAIRSSIEDHIILATLAAGHFEALINRHGDKFIERIETLAKKDESFRHFIGGVWPRRDMSKELLERLRAIALKPYWD